MKNKIKGMILEPPLLPALKGNGLPYKHAENLLYPAGTLAVIFDDIIYTEEVAEGKTTEKVHKYFLPTPCHRKRYVVELNPWRTLPS